MEQSKPKSNQISNNAIFSIISQNVRGFLMKKEWYQEFKKKNQQSGKFPEIILMQETHIHQESQVVDIRKEWNASNGIYREKETFWAPTATKAEQGVGILLNPHSNVTIVPIQTEKWTPRQMFMQWTHNNEVIIIINIYASNVHQERENDFKKLRELNLP